MQVSVHHDGNVIGTAILEHLDPPMGVAFGPFSPLAQYTRVQHANTVDSEYIADRGQSLTVELDPYGRLETASIAIEDWNDPELGKQLTIWFRDGTTFAALFSAHADYRAYFSKDQPRADISGRSNPGSS